MKLFKIIGLVIVLSPAGQAFGVDQTILDRLHGNDPSLTTLWLRGNQIGPAGAIALADVLRTNTSLTRLYLDGNQIGDAGAVALAEALRTNTSLTVLQLGGNQIGGAPMQEIERLMSPEGMQERRALVPWSRPRHLQLASWNPYVAPVVDLLFREIHEERGPCLHMTDPTGEEIELPYLPPEMWELILKHLNCGDFGPLALPAP